MMIESEEATMMWIETTDLQLQNSKTEGLLTLGMNHKKCSDENDGCECSKVIHMNSNTILISGPGRPKLRRSPARQVVREGGAQAWLKRVPRHVERLKMQDWAGSTCSQTAIGLETRFNGRARVPHYLSCGTHRLRSLPTQKVLVQRALAKPTATHL